jgi:hypothetical protein
MAMHMKGSNDGTETRCGRRDVFNTLDRLVRVGLPYAPPLAKTDDWTLVTCKACLKTYWWPKSGRRANGTWGFNGHTDRITFDVYAKR